MSTLGRDFPRKLFRRFSWPGGVPSYVAPGTEVSIHEGVEFGWSRAPAYGAAFQHPRMIRLCVIGDGEAETGALATSWHSNKFLTPARDVPVLPVRANPGANTGTLLAPPVMPAFCEFAAPVAAPGRTTSESTGVFGSFLAEVMRRHPGKAHFRFFGANEIVSHQRSSLARYPRCSGSPSGWLYATAASAPAFGSGRATLRALSRWDPMW